MRLIVPRGLTTIKHSMPIIMVSRNLNSQPRDFLSVTTRITSRKFLITLPRRVNDGFARRRTLLRKRSQRDFQTSRFLSHPLSVDTLLSRLRQHGPSAFNKQLGIGHITLIKRSFNNCAILTLNKTAISFRHLTRQYHPTTGLLISTTLTLRYHTLRLTRRPRIERHLNRTNMGSSQMTIIVTFTPISGLFNPTNITSVAMPAVLFNNTFSMLAPIIPRRMTAFD